MDNSTSTDAVAFTRVPNVLLDLAMRTFGHAELKVILAIARKTIGWNKTRDQISLSQFEELTGLTRRNVIKAIARLRESGFILHYRVGMKSLYELNIEGGIAKIPSTASIVEIPVLVSQGNHSGIPAIPEAVSQGNTQKKERQKKDKKERKRAARADSVTTSKDNDMIEAKEEQNSYGDLFVKISKVCRLDPKIPKNAQQISLCAKYLASRSVAPNRLDAFLSWWMANDYRGKQGEYPWPAIVSELWIRFDEAPADKPRLTSAASSSSRNGKTFRRAQVTFTDEQRRKAEEHTRRMLAEMDEEDPF